MSILPEKILIDLAVTDCMTDLAPRRIRTDSFLSSVSDFSPVQSRVLRGSVEFTSKFAMALEPTSFLLINSTLPSVYVQLSSNLLWLAPLAKKSIPVQSRGMPSMKILGYNEIKKSCTIRGKYPHLYFRNHSQ